MTIKAQTVTIGLGVLALLVCCDESKAQEPKRFDKGPSYLDRPAVSPEPSTSRQRGFDSLSHVRETSAGRSPSATKAMGSHKATPRLVATNRVTNANDVDGDRWRWELSKLLSLLSVWRWQKVGHRDLPRFATTDGRLRNETCNTKQVRSISVAKRRHLGGDELSVVAWLMGLRSLDLGKLNHATPQPICQHARCG